MARRSLSDLDFGGVARVTGLAAPAVATDAATKGYVDSAVEGLSWKAETVVATQANVNLASPGATIDTVTMVAGMRVLVMAQTNAFDNGIYIWNTATTAMTRSFDLAAVADFPNAVTFVQKGTSAGTSYRQTGTVNTIGTDSVIWSVFAAAVPGATHTQSGTVALATQAETDTGTDDTKALTAKDLANWAGRIRKFSATIGDGSSTQIDVSHNLATNDIHVAIFANSGSFDDVLVQTSRPTINTVRFNFSAAPATSSYRVVVIG